MTPGQSSGGEVFLLPGSLRAVGASRLAPPGMPGALTGLELANHGGNNCFSCLRHASRLSRVVGRGLSRRHEVVVLL